MYGETYACAHLSLSEESMSCHSTFTLVPNPTSDPGAWTSFPQSTPFISDQRANAWLPSNLQVNPEAYPRAAASNPHQSIQPPPIRDNDEGAGTLHLENAMTGINDQNCPAAHPLDFMHRTTPHSFTLAHPSCMSSESSLRGPECFGPVQVIFNENTKYADVDQTFSPRQQAVSMNPDMSHQQTRFDTTSNFSISSTPPENSCTTAVVQYQEQRASRDGRQKFQRKAVNGNRAATTSYRSPRQPLAAGRRAAPERPYSCNVCGKRYSQPQGVTRHQRETHNARLCKYCLTFEWGRPYRYREHLINRHPVVDADAALDEATALQRITTIVTQYTRIRDPVFPQAPTPEHWEDGTHFTDGETPAHLPTM